MNNESIEKFAEDDGVLFNFAGGWKHSNELKYLKKHNQLPIPNDRKIKIFYYDTYIANDCNLKCVQCCHFSPFRTNRPSKEFLISSYEAWSKRIEPEVITVGGGEPLLHPDFLEVILAMRHYFPNPLIQIVTNGLLLSKLSDDTLKQLRDAGRIIFRVSKHLDTPQFNEFVQKEENRFITYGIPLYAHNSYSWWGKFYCSDESGAPVPAGRRHLTADKCYGKVAFYGENVFYCCLIANAYNAVQEGALGRQWDFLQNYKPKTIANTQQEIFDYLTQSKLPECRICPEDQTITRIEPCQLTPEEMLQMRRKIGRKPALTADGIYYRSKNNLHRIMNGITNRMNSITDRMFRFLYPNHPATYLAANKDFLMNKYSLRTYHILFLQKIAGLSPQGKTVLEIGGSNLPRELLFDVLGVKKWVCVDDISHFWSEERDPEDLYDYRKTAMGQNDGNYKAFPLQESTATFNDFDYLKFDGTAENIPAVFDGQFDIVVSDACFEHVDNLDDVLAKILLALKPGGQFYTMFGPLWSSSVGHHYGFGSIIFDKSQERGIPPHFHLLWTEEQAREYFSANPLPCGQEELEALMSCAYHKGAYTNGYLYEDYERAVQKAGFVKYNIVPSVWKNYPVTLENIRELQKRYPGYKRFDADGMEIYGTKICSPES
jgi:SAM-dependent methyltransferase